MVKEKQRPRFNYSLIPFENGRYNSVGNSNNVLQPSESIVVKLEISNIGEGKSGPLTILLRNGEGKKIFLKKGRQALKELKKGETKTTYFQFDLKQEPDDGDLDFSFDVLDGTFPLSSLNQKIKFPIRRIADKISNIPPSIEIAAGHLLSMDRNYSLDGEIFDPGGVKDVYIFKNKKKIYYKNYIKSKNRNQVDFSLKMDLENDNNKVTIIARDNYNVTVQKNIYLRYSKSK